jgi:glutamate synthase (NADPH/NADH) small chain
MPAFQFEYEHAKQLGIQFHWLTQPVAVQPGSVECVQMELGSPDKSGRRRPQPVPGSNFFIECDMVISSIGQTRLLGFLEKCRGVELRNGTVVVDPLTGRTSNPKYYAGGDCVNGGREVVDAVAEGKRAAQGIATWLT